MLGDPDTGFQVIASDGLIWSLDVPQADPDDPSRVFSWRPSTVTDLAGQQVTYAYLADAGALYLAGIAWGPDVACDGQPAAPAFAATFDHEPRTDEVSSWLTGFLVRGWGVAWGVGGGRTGSRLWEEGGRRGHGGFEGPGVASRPPSSARPPSGEVRLLAPWAQDSSLRRPMDAPRRCDRMTSRA